MTSSPSDGSKPSDCEPSSRPLMKRLRVRGDWSDTGPNARPESERNSEEVSSPNRQQPLQSGLMQRMSDVLTRIFNSPQRQSDNSRENDESSQQNEVNVTNQISNGDASEQSASSSGASNTPMNVESSSLLSERLENLEQKLVGTRNEEPIVNLQFSGQGVSSGTILVESGVPMQNSIPDQSLHNQEHGETRPGNLDRDFSSVFNEDQFSANNESGNSIDFAGNEERNLDSNAPRSQLTSSFEDVLKHLKEERDFETSQSPQLTLPSVKQRFSGHRNARTMVWTENERSLSDVWSLVQIKEATFWGDDYVMSGSDCGHIFIWCRYSGQLIMIVEGDHHVVNCLQPHPFDPSI